MRRYGEAGVGGGDCTFCGETLRYFDTHLKKNIGGSIQTSSHRVMKYLKKKKYVFMFQNI